MPSDPGQNASEAPSGYTRAWRSPAAIILFCAVAGTALAADLLTKHWVFEHYLDQPGLAGWVARKRAEQPDLRPDHVLHALGDPVAPGVRIRLSTNPGVVFGLRLPPWLIVLVSVAATALIVGYAAATPARSWWVHAALALILAGAIGNLYDRALAVVEVPGFAEPITGEVRDFIDCSKLGWPWIFNVADAWLVAGLAMMALQGVRESLAERRRRRTESGGP